MGYQCPGLVRVHLGWGRLNVVDSGEHRWIRMTIGPMRSASGGDARVDKRH